MAGLVVVNFAHENLAPPGDPNRGPGFIAQELGALANNVRRQDGRTVVGAEKGRKRPKVIALTEAAGHRLPTLERYGDPIRSRKNEGHTNVSLYLRNGLKGPEAEWFQHKSTWPKVNDPSKRHAARVTLIKELVDEDTGQELAVLVGHGPQAPNPRLPPGTNLDLAAARHEWVGDTAALLRRYEYTIWLGDPNELMDEVLRVLGDAKAARGGDGTDAVLVRGYFLEGPGDLTVSHVNGIPMLTDHKKALLGRAERRGSS